MKALPPPRLPQRLSLVAQTARSLCEGIEQGRWRAHLPGERELAAQLLVSRDTIRAALSEMQREGRLEVTQRQRRRIKMPRVGRRAVSEQVLGILSPRDVIDLPARTAAIMDQLRARLTGAGRTVEFHVSDACFAERPERALKQLVEKHPAAAWVVFGSREPMQRWFLRQRLACLVLGSCGLPDSLTSIDTDHRAICRHAGALLWRKGHRRIALVVSRGGFGGELECEKGLREALSGHPGHQLQVLRYDSSPAHLRALLDQCLRSSTPPTAYVVASAMPVLTVMTHLLSKGRRIPQDIALLSCGDDPALDHLSPLVARYAVKPEVFARRVIQAARRLIESGITEPRTIRLMAELVGGETV